MILDLINRLPVYIRDNELIFTLPALHAQTVNITNGMILYVIPT
jgi:hypothetical protein